MFRRSGRPGREGDDVALLPAELHPGQMDRKPQFPALVCAAPRLQLRQRRPSGPRSITLNSNGYIRPLNRIAMSARSRLPRASSTGSKPRIKKQEWITLA